MSLVLSLDLLILQEPANCCIHDRRVVPQADDLRRTPPHMHDTDTAKARRIPCERWITFSHPVHSSTRLPSQQIKTFPVTRGRSSPGCERGREAGGMGPWSPFHILGITDRTTFGMHSEDTPRPGWIPTHGTQDRRQPVHANAMACSTPCPLPSAPRGLGYELPLPAWCKILEGAHRSSLYGLLITHPVKMCLFSGTLGSVLSSTRGNHSHRNSSSGIVGNHSAMLTVSRAPSVPIYPVAHARSVSGG